MTHDSCESKLRSVLQLIGTYTTLITVILVSGIIISGCFAVIYYMLVPPPPDVMPPPDVIDHGCYIVIGVINITCVGVLFYKSVPEIKKLKSGNETALSEVAILFVIMLCLSSIVVYFLDPDTPGFMDKEKHPDWMLRLSILSAPVLEEVLFRALCIGIPAFLIALIIKEMDALPPLRKYLAGGFEINKIVLIVIFFSSFMFGAAHIEGWGMWKFYVASITGLVLGYLFVKYGLYASISTHFLVNCLSLFGTPTPGPLDLLLDIMVIVSIPCVCLYVKKKGGQYFSKTLLKGKSD